MSYNGSGTFLINTAGQPVVSGTVISSTAFNALTADLATGLSTAITKDGQTTVTANIPMGTYKFTGLGAGTAATDSANLSQVQSTVTKLLASVSGADTITAVASPTLGAYAAGQMFYFVAAGTNTGAVTLNIDSLGAKAVTRDGSTALTAGDLRSGEVIVVVYDGTRFQVVSQVNSGGDATFANVSITSALNVGGVATFSAGTAAAPSITTTGDTNTGIFFPAADTIAFAEGGVEAARFDSAGNFGLGVTPSAWSGKAIEVGSKGTAIWNLNQQNSSFTCNAYYDGAYKYGGTGLASSYQQAAGIHYWYTAASGTAGNAISFTTAMVLDASGNLGVGTTSPATRLDVRNTASTTGSIVNIANSSSAAAGNIVPIRFFTGNTFGGLEQCAAIWGINPNAGTNNGGALVFATSANGTATTPSEKARINAAGRFLIGTTTIANGQGESALTLKTSEANAIWGVGPTSNFGSFYVVNSGGTGVYVTDGGTSWTSTSDERHKTNLASIENGAEKVCALRAVTGRFKTDDESVSRSFLIAQDLEKVLPEAVDKSRDDAWGIQYTDVIPLLVAAIKDQQSMINELKAKVAALEAK